MPNHRSNSPIGLILTCLSRHLTTFLLVLILLAALAVRLYKINTPLADWHSFRQADTASVAREYLINGIDLLHPRYHDLSNIQSGHDNPEGYRMVEFPVINGLVAFLYRLLPPNTLPLHVFYRLTSIVFSLGSTLLIYLLVSLLLKDKTTALIAAAIFALLPFNIYYSRAILPEVPLVFFALLQLYGLSRYFRSSSSSLTNPNYWISLISGTIALLIKPMAVFFLLPILADGFQKKKFQVFKDWRLYIYLILTFIPLILWRIWIQQYPEGIAAYDWLLNGNGIRFTPAFFRWLFAERLGKLILGYWGLILFGLGLVAPSLGKRKIGNAWAIYAWLLAIFAYLVIFATGNVQHDYYQIITIPIIAIFTALGIKNLLWQKNLPSYLLLLTSLAFMFAFSWYEIKGFYQINNGAIVKAGQAVDQFTPQDALVIAPYMGDTAFLYQTNRRGWPLGYDIDKKIKQGADFYVSTSYDDEARELENKYQVVQKTDDYILINLTQSKD